MCIFLMNKMLSFHDRKLEDFVLRKKQHKESQWTGRLLFDFLKAYAFFSYKIMFLCCRDFTSRRSNMTSGSKRLTV